MASEDVPGKRPVEPLRVMRWWWVFGGLVLAVAAGLGVMWWLFGEARTAGFRPAEEAKLRIDAIRTGLTVMAGVGGAVTLLFAARKQWLSERAQRHSERVSALIQAHDERVQAHAEKVAEGEREHRERLAADTERDAVERRVTELFSSAVEHLGSDKPPVRLGGLYALERLAIAYPEHRHTIVDVLCAYLRMPAVEGDETVRRTAQEILLRHLRPGLDDYWEGLHLDLRGAELVGFTAAACVFSVATFHRAKFRGVTSFNDATMVAVNFNEAEFEDHAIFADTEWRGPTKFRGVTFGGPASFDGGVFHESVSFAEGTRMAGDGSFRGVRFHREAIFDWLEFAGECSFRRAEFGRGASFEHTVFRRRVAFRDVRFRDMAMFRWATFYSDAGFDRTFFSGTAMFDRARFEGLASFDGARMSGRCQFDNCRISGDGLRSWPSGWYEQPADDETLTLVRSSHQ
jgi:uncharacterized protein YjbI with pentapeptide repeats